MSIEKTVVITGGNRGIGKAVALKAMELNWNVVISYKNHEDSAIELVSQANSVAKAFPLDVRSPESIKYFFESVEKEFGVPDALIASAGINNKPMSIGCFEYSKLHEVFDVNALGLIYCCDSYVSMILEEQNSEKYDKNNKRYSIVNISSLASTIGGRSGKTIYAASKGAVDAFTIGAAKELAKSNIDVFAVRPGVTKTDMTEPYLSDSNAAEQIKKTIACGEVAEPSDIAKPILNLISGDFAYASGSVLNLGGGGFLV